MTTRRLDELFERMKSAPPVIPEDNISGILARGATDTRRRGIWSRSLPFIIGGVLMTMLIALIIGQFFLPYQEFADRPEQPARQNSTTTHITPDSIQASQQPDSTAGPASSKARSNGVRIRHMLAQSALSVRGAQMDIDPTKSDGSAASADIAALPFRLLHDPVFDPSDDGELRTGRVSLVPTALRLHDAVAFPHVALPSDSGKTGRDSVWNYAGVYMNIFYTSRGFSELNTRLSAKGFPSIDGNGGFGSGLSFEFPRPGRDSAAPMTFPVFLYPATDHYTPGFSIEWMTNPEVNSADNLTKASFSSWTFTADNMFFHTYRLSRMMLVLSFGVNLTSITVGRSRNFDDFIGATDAGAITMSRASMFIRPALRYDIIPFLGLQFGISAGYTFPLSTGNWRLRSSFEFDPGITAGNGPDDSIGGWHFGFSFTLRGTESAVQTW